MYQDLLPLSLQGEWRAQPAQTVADNLSSWLYESGSLTRRLKDNCNSFRVAILAKHQRRLSADEQCLLNCPGGAVQVREVLLFCDEQPHVYAQTLMPLENVPESVDQLVSLGEKPLGEVIFNQPNMLRSDIEVCPFGVDSSVVQLCERIGQAVGDTLWGRRSCFIIDGYRLSVAEVFLPGARAYR